MLGKTVEQEISIIL